MGIQDVGAFFAKLSEDEELRNRLSAIETRARTQADSMLTELVQLAAEAGFAFSPEELLQARSKTAELPAAEVEAIRGLRKATPSCDSVSNQVWCDGTNIGMWGCFPMQWV